MGGLANFAARVWNEIQRIGGYIWDGIRRVGGYIKERIPEIGQAINLVKDAITTTKAIIGGISVTVTLAASLLIPSVIGRLKLGLIVFSGFLLFVIFLTLIMIFGAVPRGHEDDNHEENNNNNTNNNQDIAAPSQNNPNFENEPREYRYDLFEDFLASVNQSINDIRNNEFLEGKSRLYTFTLNDNEQIVENNININEDIFEDFNNLEIVQNSMASIIKFGLPEEEVLNNQFLNLKFINSFYNDETNPQVGRIILTRIIEKLRENNYSIKIIDNNDDGEPRETNIDSVQNLKTLKMIIQLYDYINIYN